VKNSDGYRFLLHRSASRNLTQIKSGGFVLALKEAQRVPESLEVESYPRLNAEHRRALRLLADAPHGCAISIMLAHGFSNSMLGKLMRDGVATLQLGTVRMTITDIGRGALAVE
jgi:hypothetical protein